MDLLRYTETDSDFKCADWIMDMGPDGGQGGGKLVAQGTPEEVSKTDGSHTGYYLKRVLKRAK